MTFLSPGDVQSENSEKLEFDDTLNENAMLLRSHGLQNEAKMVPKRAEKRKKSREEGKREQLWCGGRGEEGTNRVGGEKLFRSTPGSLICLSSSALPLPRAFQEINIPMNRALLTSRKI